MSGAHAMARVWRRGYEAAHRGIPATDCPYLQTSNRDAWGQGHADGLREAERARSSRPAQPLEARP